MRYPFSHLLALRLWLQDCKPKGHEHHLLSLDSGMRRNDEPDHSRPKRRGQSRPRRGSVGEDRVPSLLARYSSGRTYRSAPTGQFLPHRAEITPPLRVNADQGGRHCRRGRDLGEGGCGGGHDSKTKISPHRRDCGHTPLAHRQSLILQSELTLKGGVLGISCVKSDTP